MASSIVAGERKWASARRGGMTVLGKVAVPKPINLPSQRLENHGLDPNVEIVPKGTHSWGGRSSFSTSNAWGPSTLSPNTDGGNASPSHLSGRPSSGGSGTPPSTASSDRTHEPFANAWSSNSRPSSASGALTSNQISVASLRPRSAETRPGSSQLSRFAEPLPDNSVAWEATGTTEKSGLLSSKNDGFSLTSGDFPTLGSEKETSGRNSDVKELGSHGRPGSSSSVVAGKEGTGNSAGDISVNANLKVGNADSWRRENPMYSEDGARLGVEKWQADPHPYPNSSIPPQHYDAWHGPPVNNHPGGVWYRQPPGGPPFGPPVGPGGFPMEPFPYYRPQIPPAALANHQSIPPPRAGPGGPHPKNGDMYRPPMHDAYVRPGMPLRPGFYPSPVPYEMYYGPPMGYCNAGERDIPFTGMGMGPPAYNRYSGQPAPDLANPHGRSSGYGPSSKSVISELGESGRLQDARGPFKVLMKQHDGWDGKDEPKQDESMKINSDAGKRDYPRKSSWENGWGADCENDEEIDTRRMAQAEESLDRVNNQVGIPINVKASERIGIFKSSDDSSVKKFENAGNVSAEVSTVPEDPGLIQKIEGLNAKVRASTGRPDAKSISNREEQKNELQVCNARVSSSLNEAVMGPESLKITRSSGLINTASHEDYNSAGDRNLVSSTSRRPRHGIYDRAEYRSKGRYSAQEADGYRRRSQATNSPNVVLTSDFESSSAVQGQDHVIVGTEESVLFPQRKNDGEPVPHVADTTDTQAQRAKMKELAEQRRRQREKEEEERTRDQKAKARAKLEELNRRTQAGEGSTVKLEAASTGVIENKLEELSSPAQPTIVAGKSKELGLAVVSNTNSVPYGSERSGTGVEKSASLNTGMQTTMAAHKEPVLLEKSEPLQHELLQQEVHIACSTNTNTTPHVHSSSAYKQKRMGYRQKQDIPSEMYSTERLIFSPTTESLKNHTDAAPNAPVALESVSKEIASNSELSLPVNPSVTVESSTHQRRKGKPGKNKQSVAEASPTLASSSLASKDTIALDILVESDESKTSESLLDPASSPSEINSKDAHQFSEQRLLLSAEEAHIRVNNQGKSHHSRRLPRNSLANKVADKLHSSDSVIWAPVRSQSKTEVSEEAGQNSVVETVGPSLKGDHQVQSNPRNKRAEMERYVPKPAAKEMAQQGSGNQLVAPLISQITTDHTTGRTQSGSLGTESSKTSVESVGKVASTVESRNGDGRQNKSSKERGSWRQRSSGESVDSSLSKNSQKMIEHHQSQKTNTSSVKEQSNYSDEWNASDGGNIPEDSGAAVTVPVVKDQGMTARGKRQPYRGQKSAGHNRDSDEKKINSGDTERVPSTVTDACQADVHATSKEFRATGERLASHWQPKSQQFSDTSQRGSRPNGSQKDSSLQGAVSLTLQAGKETAVVRDEPHHDQSLSEKSNLEEAVSVEHQETKKGKNMAAHKGHPGSSVEPSPSLNMDFRHEHALSGFRKSGNQNSRFGRDHEFAGEWNGSGKDNKQHNLTTNRERPKRNSHYEYQPVGPHNNTQANNLEPPKDSSHNSSARFKERGQSNSRRGGISFHGRPSGNV